MKLITFAVPSYNSQDYLNKCVDSLLMGGEDVEIIIVDDGSTDGTAALADAYEAAYPAIVRAVHKPNGGHGSGVNKGLELATGLYYKVVDSDDWLDVDALKTLLSTLKRHVAEGETADLYVTNFVYERVADKSRYVSRYTGTLPVNRFFGWEETKPLRLWKMYLMHALIYRTEMLRATGLKLPEHTFYVDNIFAYTPLPYVKKLFYLNIDLYRYYIGRSDQSVTVDNAVKRFDQQINITRIMLREYGYNRIESMCKPLRRQMYHCLHVMLMNTYFFTTAKDEPLRRQLFALMWNELKINDKKLYRRLKRMPLVWILDRLCWKVKGRVTTTSYRFLCKHVKLGA